MLGGGLAGLTAAFYLSSTPELRSKFRVTLYTDGHQLGGKAASHRGVGDRIEEHGLHVMLGFYENTFRTLAEAWTPRGPFRTMWDAFEPHYDITFPEHALHGDVRIWERWTVDYPERPGLPGDGVPVELDLVDAMVDWLDRLVEHVPTDAGVPRPLRPVLRARSRGVLSWLERVGAWLSEELDKPRVHDLGDRIRRVVRLLQIGSVILRGYVQDVLPHGPEAFDVLDHLEFRDWLKKHGASDELSWWAPIRAFYTLGFAFRGGRNDDEDAGSVAAGVALRILLRYNLAYKKAPAFRMRAGMGEVVIAPLYEALLRQGVHVRFFHRLERIGLGRDGRVASLRMDAARVPWKPLVEVGGLPTWRASAPPLERQRVMLRRSRSFDQVVLALPAPALPHTCRSLRRVPGWSAMLDGVPTVATQAAQLWLRRSSKELGWDRPNIVTGYAPPWDSWADMSQLLAVESGDASSLHYLVSTLPDDGRAELDEWLDWHGHFLFARDGARWDPRDEVMRYVRENKEGSARYVQSPPGSIGLRLRPGGSGVPNLWLAGDWTRTTLSAGSAEAAVQSGMLAARALGGHPVDIAM